MNDSNKKLEGKKRRLANLIPAAPGEVRNPNGRPKLENTFSHIARELLQAKKIDITYTFPKNGTMVKRSMHMESDKSMNHSLAAVLIKEGMAGNVRAIQEIIDRTEGKPNQKVDITTQGDKITNEPDISDLSPEAIAKLSDAILAIKK